MRVKDLKPKQLAALARQPWQPLVRTFAATMDCPAGMARAYVNHLYSVQVYPRPSDWGDILLLMVRRHDGAPVRSWADMQRIKNEIAGPSRVAVEVYPDAADVVDQANIYHLWVLPAGFTLPFGLHLSAPVAAAAAGEGEVTP